MSYVTEKLDDYGALTLVEAAREAERLTRQLSSTACDLLLLYEAHDRLNLVQPADENGTIPTSFDEWHLELGALAECWGVAADMLEGADGYYLFGRFEKHDCEGELRGPYPSPDQPEDWAKGGYSSRAARVVKVTAAEFQARSNQSGYGDN